MRELRLFAAVALLTAVVYLLPRKHPSIAALADLVNDLGFGE